MVLSGGVSLVYVLCQLEGGGQKAGVDSVWCRGGQVRAGWCGQGRSEMVYGDLRSAWDGLRRSGAARDSSGQSEKVWGGSGPSGVV